MALSNEEIRVLGIALGDDALAASIAAKINAGANPVAAVVAAIGATSNFSAVATGGTPDCDAAAVDSVIAEVESRMDAVESKIDEVIAALKVAGLMDS